MKLTIDIRLESGKRTRKDPSELAKILRRCASKLEECSSLSSGESWFVCDSQGDEVGAMEISKS